MLPLTPTKLGRYEILDEIGKGAMGVVYLARDPLIGRLVALKTFRMGFSVRDQEAEQFRARFIREAQSAGILSHPNIVTIHDVVESAGDGLSFIAMEYVRGTNLKMVMQADPSLPLGRVADIVSQVAEALDYAHSQRVIHRDVKPANIIITEDGRVKITDFGIARLDTSNLTQEGQLLGTPNYMAPEQVQGKEVDHRADIFALGVVLYEMLTRHKPFQGENLTVVSHRIVYDQFTPLREYARNVPPGVEKIISRALEKDPNRRYQKARELAEDLKKLVAESLNGDELNETQSLSSTMVIPAGSAPLGASSTASPSTVGPGPGSVGSGGSVGSAGSAGAAAPARKPLWGRLFGGGKSAPAPAPAPVAVAPPPLVVVPAAPDIPSGTGTGSGSQPAAPAGPVAVPPPPPLPPATPANDDGSVASASSAPGMASATGSSVSIPPPPPLPMPAMPAPPRARKGSSRIIGAVIAALFLGFIIFWGIARKRDSQPAPTPPVVAATPQPSPVAVDVAQLLEQGNGLMRRGQFAEAAEAYRTAEPHAQDQPDVPWLRQEAEKLQVEFDAMVSREQDVEAKIREANTAWLKRSYPEVIAAADFVLQSRPKDTAIASLAKRARAEAKRQSGAQMAAAGERSPEATPATESTPTEVPSEAETSSGAAQKASLHIYFRVDGSAQGTVRVYQDGVEIRKFDFRRRVTILDKDEENALYTETAQVTAGSSNFMVLVSVDGRNQRSIRKAITGDVPGGTTRRLDIRLNNSNVNLSLGS